jgi:hypothetical protein
MPVRSAPWIALGLALVLLASPATAQTFDATGRGWFNSTGAHTATNLTAFVGQGSGTTRFRGFFVFDLTALGQPVGSALLRLELEAFLGPDASEVFAVYDVSTSPDQLLLTQTGRTDVYADLGTGVAYAVGVASPAQVGTVLELPLSEEAVAALNAAAGGPFAIGVSVESLRLPSGSEGVRFSLTNEPRVHQLVLTEALPEPPTLEVAPVLAGMVPPSEHAVTAQLMDPAGTPVAGAPVDFAVTSGPHAGLAHSAVTDESGAASFTYAGSATGVDRILASLADGSSEAPQAEATAVWDADCNANQVPDACDLSCDGWDGACAGFVGCGASPDTDANGEPDECFVAPPPPPPGNAAPDCSGATAAPGLLLHPNHRFRAVSIDGVVDPDGDPVAVTVEDVYQDEVTELHRMGSTCPDARGLGDDQVWLRAERKERGDGRVYHLDFTADDGKGGVCEGTVRVCVPRSDRRGRGMPCVDQGPLFDSETCQRCDYRGHRGHHRHGHSKGRH